MANYSVEGFVSNGVGGAPVRAVVAAFSRETFALLGRSQSNFEDGHYYIEFINHPGPVFVVCFHSEYGADPGVEPYFSLTSPPTGEAEVHDNITPVELPPF